jgi:hypothetical protein
MKYVEKSFALRIHRQDGTLKLLLGVTGSPPKIGSLMHIRVAGDELLMIKMVDHPRGDKPEAIELVHQVGVYSKTRTQMKGCAVCFAPKSGRS